MDDIFYVDCTITVHDERRLSFKADYGREHANVALGGDALTLLTIERLAGWVEADPLCSKEHLELLGKHLYRCLFGRPGSDVHDAFRSALLDFKAKAGSRKEARLRLTLAFEPAASRLAGLPWEFLHIDDRDGDFFISAPANATQLILTRFVPPLPEIDNFEPAERPLRILVVVASPTGSGGDVRAETLLPQLRKLHKERDDVDIKIMDENPRFEDIEAELEPKDQNEPRWWPHIFHFVGHGDVRDDAAVVAIRMSEKEAVEHYGDTGSRTDAKWIPIGKLVELFPADRCPRLVFLHACKGAKRQSYRAFTTGAEEFVRAGVRATIAMQYDIANEEADFFAQQFYERLGNGLPVDDAVTGARVQLAKRSTPNSWGDRRFGTPQLLLQSSRPVLLRPRKDVREAPPEQPHAPSSTQAYDCPYRYDRGRLCDRLVHRPLDSCPRCGGELVWCVNGHPCMADDRRCSSCSADLPKSSPAERPRAAQRGASGFG
jgi:hypothetical protein